MRRDNNFKKKRTHVALHFPHGVMTHGVMIPTFKFPVSTSVPCNNGNCYKEAYKTTNVGIGIVKNVTFK